jgi:hypothetical protein
MYFSKVVGECKEFTPPTKSKKLEININGRIVS